VYEVTIGGLNIELSDYGKKETASRLKEKNEKRPCGDRRKLNPPSVS